MKLRASPTFVQALSYDGRAYLQQEVEPYAQFWLSERERLLLALFSRRGGLTEGDAIAAALRLQGKDTTPARRQLARDIAGMLQAGVLLRDGDDTSRYSRRIVDDYVKHRPFPAPIAQALVASAPVKRGTRVLDLAGGPGDLALALARHSDHVSLMELSRGFLAAARQRARAAGVQLQTLHDSCNRLPQRDDEYDLITISQALHWLDDLAVCRGVCRLLAAGGSFVVIHSAIELPSTHPLAYLLGHDSILGAKARVPFPTEAQALARRLALLFEALDSPAVARIDPSPRRALPPIGFAGARFFDQSRPFDAGYARGFLTPQHIAVTGMDEAAFWADMHARCEAVDGDAMQGLHRWVVLEFKRGASAPVAVDSATAARIGF